MNNIAHASSKDDIATSYEYMVHFLDLDGHLIQQQDKNIEDNTSNEPEY